MRGAEEPAARRVYLLPVLQAWHADALCREYPEVEFFVESGEIVAARQAKAICARCLVLEECRSYALANNETEGIWGGTTPRLRRSIRRKMALGRAGEHEAIEQDVGIVTVGRDDGVDPGERGEPDEPGVIGREFEDVLGQLTEPGGGRGRLPGGGMVEVVGETGADIHVAMVAAAGV